jgi:glycosyltransferase involved in cell wall biosynthesis
MLAGRLYRYRTTDMGSHSAISVVIPTYNRADLLGEAIDSVLAQDWPNLEVVVVDDGSTDPTPELLSSFGDRLRVIRQENAGESNARNTGIRAARHDLVALLDSDNRWLPGKLRRQMELFLADPAPDFTFTAYTAFGDVQREDVVLDGWKPTQEGALEQLLAGCRINTSTVVATRESLISAGLFDEGLRCAQDYELWLRVAVEGRRIAYLPEPLTEYRIHGGAVSGGAALVNTSTEFVLERLFDSGVLPDRFQRQRTYYLARSYLNSACYYLESGEGEPAAAAITRAARTRPASIRPGWLLIWARARRIAAAGQP